MKKDRLLRKGLVVAIILLFVGASVIPSIGGNIDIGELDVEALGVTDITSTSAKLNAIVLGNIPVKVWFYYGLTDNIDDATEIGGQQAHPGETFSQVITDLSPRTTYHWWVYGIQWNEYSPLSRAWTDLDYGGTFTTLEDGDELVGYAIVVAGQGRWFAPGDKHAIDHAANNAYRVLRNLGFDNDHIFYLNDEFQQINGQSIVDTSASLATFQNSLNEIKQEIGASPTPIIIYLVGHGHKEIFDFDPDGPCAALSSYNLRDFLEDFPNNPILVVIVACYSGSFITVKDPLGGDSISVENKDRIIITTAHDGLPFGIVAYPLAISSSDRFWGNLNRGLNVKEAYCHGAWPIELPFLWLDDNGDSIGHPQNNLDDDGDLATATWIGVPYSEDFELIPWYYFALNSPGELRIYDSQNRVTGLVDGEIKEEIPNSIYFEENRIVAIFSPSDSYRCEIIGTDDGTYGLDVAFIDDGNITFFMADAIPIGPGMVHQYIINWFVLSQGGEGVTIQIDSDGDGIFERTIISDEELTQDEFMLQTTTIIDINPDTLNLNSSGNWITCYIELSEGYDVTDINISMILLNDVVPAEDHPTNISDYDNDGIHDIMMKFDRQAVQDILEPGENVAITVTGKLFDETRFEGIDYIRVI